jgi:gamma-butyrobetaine dioxygenase
LTDILDQLQEIFESEGANAYLGENVSTAEHMLQAAARAEDTQAGDALVAAALLHDIGYFTDVRMDAAKKECEHDLAGAAFLSGHFGPEVTEPMRLHVQAKRYLCAVEPSYWDKLSAASVRTLGLQGGPMDAEEVAAFESNPHYREAVQIRRYDDEGKVEGSPSRSFSSFRELLTRLRTDSPPSPE